MFGTLKHVIDFPYFHSENYHNLGESDLKSITSLMEDETRE
jgi:hypothetical protein